MGADVNERRDQKATPEAAANKKPEMRKRTTKQKAAAEVSAPPPNRKKTVRCGRCNPCQNPCYKQKCASPLEGL